MDPIIVTLGTAFLIGAAEAAQAVGKSAITDAYEALKSLVKSSYQASAALLESITRLEDKPASEARLKELQEELTASGALDDAAVLTAAEGVITAAESHPDQLPPSIGIDWQAVKAARVKIGKIRVRAGAIGLRAARSELKTVEIDEIDASGK